MQKRFCTCGASVWVRYIYANMRWLTFFYSGDDSYKGTSRCPHCGCSLNIQDLR